MLFRSPPFDPVEVVGGRVLVERPDDLPFGDRLTAADDVAVKRVLFNQRLALFGRQFPKLRDAGAVGVKGRVFGEGKAQLPEDGDDFAGNRRGGREAGGLDADQFHRLGAVGRRGDDEIVFRPGRTEAGKAGDDRPGVDGGNRFGGEAGDVKIGRASCRERV